MSDVVVEITNDVFDVAARLKEIDGAYYPVYNLTRRRYEIKNRTTGKTEVVLPYNSLDIRALNRVRETRIEYALAKIKEMDKRNEELERANERRNSEEASYKAKDLFKTVKRSI